MSTPTIKALSQRLIIDSLVSGELFHCLKCEKEIKRDSKSAEFTTPHILIDETAFLMSDENLAGECTHKVENSDIRILV